MGLPLLRFATEDVYTDSKGQITVVTTTTFAHQFPQPWRTRPLNVVAFDTTDDHSK